MDSNSIGNRYYTPEISEFHIGFQYYEKQTDKIVGPFEIRNFDDIMCTEEDIVQGLVLVKYLDVEDMLSLGFTQDEDYKCPFTGKSGNRFHRTDESVGFNNGVYFIIILSGKGVIQLEYKYYSSYSNRSGKLQMFIKNKSELSKLLNQFSN